MIATPIEAVEYEAKPIKKLTRDVKNAAITLGRDEVRFLVDSYYIQQENRIRCAAQVRALAESGEPHEVLQWYYAQAEATEDELRKALLAYARSQPAGRWALSICGIGPVITAGLLAHIDIEKAKYAGQVWAFAGLNPEAEWKKGEKRPWNASLKRLCWLIGESFVKVSGRESDFYGKFYREHKEREIARNESGELAGQAAAKLEKFKIGKSTEAFAHYSGGKLPPAHIHARAKRYAVKMFLSHFHHVLHLTHYGTPPPVPFIVASDAKHNRIVEPPNLEVL